MFYDYYSQQNPLQKGDEHMAIYRCEIKPITRPQSIVGKIAYRTGEKIESIYTGETFDYRRKSYIMVYIGLACARTP